MSLTVKANYLGEYAGTTTINTIPTEPVVISEEPIPRVAMTTLSGGSLILNLTYPESFWYLLDATATVMMVLSWAELFQWSGSVDQQSLAQLDFHELMGTYG